jgi:phosphoglycolate phosphatase
LEDLRREGCKLAVVSNKADPAVKALAEQYFPGMFHVALGEGGNIPKKPSPEGVRQVMKQLGVPRERTVYVGDSEVDIATADNAGLDSIIVTWGFREESFLRQQGGRHLIHTPEKIIELVKNC